MDECNHRTSVQSRAAEIKRYVMDNPGARAKEISQQLKVGEPAVSNAVQLLKDQGVVVQYKEEGKAGYALKIKQSDSALRRKMLTQKWK